MLVKVYYGVRKGTTPLELKLRRWRALHFVHYNFVRIHQALEVTPAMEAGLTDHLWSMGELLDAAMAVREQVVEVAA